jgi:hypothetical protein
MSGKKPSTRLSSSSSSSSTTVKSGIQNKSNVTNGLIAGLALCFVLAVVFIVFWAIEKAKSCDPCNFLEHDNGRTSTGHKNYTLFPGEERTIVQKYTTELVALPQVGFSLVNANFGERSVSTNLGVIAKDQVTYTLARNPYMQVSQAVVPAAGRKFSSVDVVVRANGGYRLLIVDEDIALTTASKVRMFTGREDAQTGVVTWMEETSAEQTATNYVTEVHARFVDRTYGSSYVWTDTKTATGSTLKYAYRSSEVGPMTNIVLETYDTPVFVTKLQSLHSITEEPNNNIVTDIISLVVASYSGTAANDMTAKQYYKPPGTLTTPAWESTTIYTATTTDKFMSNIDLMHIPETKEVMLLYGLNDNATQIQSMNTSNFADFPWLSAPTWTAGPSHNVTNSQYFDSTYAPKSRTLVVASAGGVDAAVGWDDIQVTTYPLAFNSLTSTATVKVAENKYVTVPTSIYVTEADNDLFFTFEQRQLSTPVALPMTGGLVSYHNDTKGNAYVFDVVVAEGGSNADCESNVTAAYLQDKSSILVSFPRQGATAAQQAVSASLTNEHVQISYVANVLPGTSDV